MASIKEAKLYNQSGQLISPVTIVDSIKMSDGTKLIDYLNSRGTVPLSGTTISGGSTNVNEINLYKNGEWITPYIVADSIKMRNGKKLIDAINEVLVPKDWTYTRPQDNISTHLIKYPFYGNGKFIATGLNGQVYTSSDGINWQGNITDTAYRDYGGCYGNGKYVMSGEKVQTSPYETYATIAYSYDGINWTRTSPLFTMDGVVGICYGNGRFVAAYNQDINSTDYTRVAYSTDGINWNSTLLSTEGYTWAYSICYGNGKYLIGEVHNIWYSTNAVNWTSTATIPIDYVTGICYSPDLNRFVAVGNTDHNYGSISIMYSSDGVNWYSASNPLGSDAANTVCYGNGMFVALTYNKSTLYSYDGINWNIADTYNDYGSSEITYGDGKFVYVADNSIYYSQVRI